MLQDLHLVLHDVFLRGRQAEPDRLEATDYSIADQLWMITSSAVLPFRFFWLLLGDFEATPTRRG